MTDTDFVMALADRIDKSNRHTDITILLDTVESLVQTHSILPPDWGHVVAVIREAIREPSMDGPVGRAHRLTGEAKKFLAEHSMVEMATMMVRMYESHIEYYQAPYFINTWAAHAREGMTF